MVPQHVADTTVCTETPVGLVAMLGGARAAVVESAGVGLAKQLQVSKSAGEGAGN